MPNEGINPEFRTATWMGEKSLNEEKVLEKLENNQFEILRKFHSRGFIANKDFDFVKQISFDLKTKNAIDGEKNDEEIELAKRNIETVEQFLASHGICDVKLELYSKDRQCALVDKNKFYSNMEISEKLKEYFEN